MIIGPAVDEAAEYFTMPDWMGISAAPSAHQALNKLEKEIIESNYSYLKYDIPLKQGVERNGWALNWPHGDVDDHTNTQTKSKLLRRLAKSTEVGVSFKFRNTIDFYSFAEKKTIAWHKSP